MNTDPFQRMNEETRNTLLTVLGDWMTAALSSISEKHFAAAFSATISEYVWAAIMNIPIKDDLIPPSDMQIKDDESLKPTLDRIKKIALLVEFWPIYDHELRRTRTIPFSEWVPRFRRWYSVTHDPD